MRVRAVVHLLDASIDSLFSSPNTTVDPRHFSISAIWKGFNRYSFEIAGGRRPSEMYFPLPNSLYGSTSRGQPKKIYEPSVCPDRNTHLRDSYFLNHIAKRAKWLLSGIATRGEIGVGPPLLGKGTSGQPLAFTSALFSTNYLLDIMWDYYSDCNLLLCGSNVLVIPSVFQD